MQLAPGRRAILTALATSPQDALERALQLDPQPAPGAPAPDEVVIAVRAAAVGWVDLLMTSGQYQHVPELPYTPGLEFAGEVVAVGSAVTRPAVGDLVIADGLRTGPRSLGAHRRFGGFASYAVAPADAVIPLPAGFSLAEIKAEDGREVRASLDRIAGLLDGRPTVASLSEAEKVKVFNEQEVVNTILTRARADSRVVCTRERRVGSHRTTSVCYTVAERRRMHDQTQNALIDNRRVQLPASN